MERTASPHVLIVRVGALGDTLLAFPTLGLMRHHLPAARITLVGRADVLGLAMASGLADVTACYDAPGWGVLFGASPRGPSAEMQLLRQADVILAWLANDEDALATRLRPYTNARVHVTTGRPVTDATEHAALLLAHALAPLGIARPPDLAALTSYLPRMRAPRQDVGLAQQCIEALGAQAQRDRMVALAPGSGSAAKRWPAEHYAWLASAARAAGYHPVLIEGPQDADVVRAVLAACPAGVVLPVACGLPVGALAVLLAHSAAYVGNDSGVSHLAGMLDRPAIVLFGPTDPLVWAPLGSRVRVLRAPGGALAQLPPAHVLAALGAALGT